MLQMKSIKWSVHVLPIHTISTKTINWWTTSVQTTKFGGFWYMAQLCGTCSLMWYSVVNHRIFDGSKSSIFNIWPSNLCLIFDHWTGSIIKWFDQSQYSIVRIGSILDIQYLIGRIFERFAKGSIFDGSIFDRSNIEYWTIKYRILFEPLTQQLNCP
jgi:hypothetical protein